MADKTGKKDDITRRLLTFTVPEICIGVGEYRAMDYRIKPRIGRTRIVGPAVTVDVQAGEGFNQNETNWRDYHKNQDGLTTDKAGNQSWNLDSISMFLKLLNLGI